MAFAVLLFVYGWAFPSLSGPVGKERLLYSPAFSLFAFLNFTWDNQIWGTNAARSWKQPFHPLCNRLKGYRLDIFGQGIPPRSRIYDGNSFQLQIIHGNTH